MFYVKIHYIPKFTLLAIHSVIYAGNFTKFRNKIQGVTVSKYIISAQYVPYTYNCAVEWSFNYLLVKITFTNMKQKRQKNIYLYFC